MACCGASRAPGMSASRALVLGEDDGSGPQYLMVNDNNLVSGVRAGQMRFFKGSGVAAAIEEGLLSLPVTRTRSKIRYSVTIGDRKPLIFSVEQTAKAYADKTGGTLEVIQYA